MVARFEVTAAVQVPLGDEAPLPGVPDLALRKERAPNLVGAELLGYTRAWDAAVRQAASAAVVVLLDPDLSPAEEAVLSGARGVLLVLATVASDSWPTAEVILPVTNVAEETGTYVNRDRRVQLFHQAKAQPAMARPAWWVAAGLLAGDVGRVPATASEAFKLLSDWWPVFGGMTHADLGYTGRVLGADAPAEVAG